MKNTEKETRKEKENSIPQMPFDDALRKLMNTPTPPKGSKTKQKKPANSRFSLFKEPLLKSPSRNSAIEPVGSFLVDDFYEIAYAGNLQNDYPVVFVEGADFQENLDYLRWAT